MVLPMGWVDSPKLFCAFLGTLTDVANALVDTDLPVPAYQAISDLLPTGPGPPHTCISLIHIDCYMDNVISAVQGDLEKQHQVFDSTVCAIKWLLPSLPGESKDSVSVKKLLAEERCWTCIKDIIRWIIDMKSVTVALPERKLQKL